MAEFQSIFTGQEVDNTINKLRSWIAVDGTYPTVTISGVTYAVIWKSIPVSGTACYGIGLHPTTGRPYQIYYNGSSYSATAFDTDTKNTAGSTNSTSKLFLIGAGSQAANPQTYSNSDVYAQDGSLYATAIQAAIIKAKTSSSATSYGAGQAGQVLISNGSSTYWGSSVNADTVDNFHMTDQSMAYSGSLDIKIGCVNAVVQTGKTEAEIFALSGSLYGKLYLASDTNKYYRRHSTATGASSSYWTDVSTLAAEALALPNQLTTEDYVYIKVDLKQMYYSNLVRFYVTAGYDNTNGSTTIIGFCRAQNNFEITACNYNGNNLKGIYQVSSNTDVYIFKFNRFQSSYGGGALYINPTIKFNQYSGTPTITFINKNHADYNTVKAYSYKSVPTQGVSYYVDLYDNGTTLSSKYIAKSLTSTKGDIIYASAANTPARLAIGSNGQFLSVSNGVPAWVNNPNTDTDKKTASSNSTSKLYLIGATAQSTDGQATYSNANVYTQNGAIFANGGTINGLLKFSENVNAIDFRPTNTSYTTNVAYESAGNEALVFKTLNSVTSFIFANGVTSATGSSEWQSITPGLQIKNNSVSIGALIANGVTPTYKLAVNGTANATTLYENGTSLADKYIAKSLTSTKGDIIYASDANTPSRLAIGSNGQFLSIASGVPTWVNNPNSDTKNTAGSTNSTSKLFLIGAATQDTNPQTYSNQYLYAQAGSLYANGISTSYIFSSNASITICPNGGDDNFNISYDDNDGTTARSSGHFTAWGDDDNGSSYKPTNQTGFNDLDTDYFNTGITLRGDETYKLSFPAKSGIIGTQIDIVDLTSLS